MSAERYSTHRAETRTSGVPLSRILIAGLVAIAASVVANLITRAILFALFDLPAEFPPLQPGSIAFFTIIGVALGTAVYAIISRFSANPARTFMIVAIVALVLSILPNLGLMANPAGAPFPGGSALAFGSLVVFHIVAAAVSVFILTRMARAE